MSRPDLLAGLRGAPPVAPAELRERIRALAAAAELPARRPARRPTWRRALVVAAALAAAAAAAAVLLPGTRHEQPAVPSVALAPDAVGAEATHGSARSSAAPGARAKAAPSPAPAPSTQRLQRYSASLELQVSSPRAVSTASNEALAIANALGGYLTTVKVEAGARTGSASLVLRVPVTRVQAAVRRLSRLGTIVSADVSVQDLQAQVDSANRLLRRLRARLGAWRALPATDTTQRHIDALTAQIRRRQVAGASTVRTAQQATIRLRVATAAPAPVVLHGHGPLHNLGVALRWAAIGAVYVLAFAVPAALLGALGWLAARAVRRRREERLLA